jgi:hypothetical protein
MREYIGPTRDRDERFVRFVNRCATVGMRDRDTECAAMLVAMADAIYRKLSLEGVTFQDVIDAINSAEFGTASIATDDTPAYTPAARDRQDRRWLRRVFPWF